MATDDNLPATTKPRDIATPAGQTGSLLSRGLEAIKNRQLELASANVILPLKSYYQHSRSKIPVGSDLRTIAEQGDMEAQFYLGMAYYEENGMASNVTDAIKWWIKAAEQGCAAAQYQLGCAYGRGEGVPKDNVKAYMWFYLEGWLRSGDQPEIFYNPSSDEQREQIEKFISSEQVVNAKKLATEVAEKYMTSEEISQAISEAERYAREREEDDAS